MGHIVTPRVTSAVFWPQAFRNDGLAELVRMPYASETDTMPDMSAWGWLDGEHI